MDDYTKTLPQMKRMEFDAVVSDRILHRDTPTHNETLSRTPPGLRRRDLLRGCVA
jgi:hypothetical protein